MAGVATPAFWLATPLPARFGDPVGMVVGTFSSVSLTPRLSGSCRRAAREALHGIHPNDEGYRRMAEAIEINALTGTPVERRKTMPERWQ